MVAAERCYNAMNNWIFAAAVGSFAVFGLHLVGGGMDVHQPTLASDLPTIHKAYASVLWHFASAVLLFNSVALLVAAKQVHLSRPLVYLVSSQYLAFVVLFLGYGQSRLQSLWEMPQWLLFLPLLVLAVVGVRRHEQSPHARFQD